MVTHLNAKYSFVSLYKIRRNATSPLKWKNNFITLPELIFYINLIYSILNPHLSTSVERRRGVGWQIEGERSDAPTRIELANQECGLIGN